MTHSRRRCPSAVHAALLGRQHAGVDEPDGVVGLLDDSQPPAIDALARPRLMLAGVRAAGVMVPPRPPGVELRPRGRRHSIERDARAVRHHYDVSNDFVALFLDESMTYSCALFGDDDEPLQAAQERKLETVCTKLALRPGERVLDVGCGWGSFPIHAASHHGVRVVGITLSEPQAWRASAPPRRASATASSFASWTYRELRGEPPSIDQDPLRRDREHRHGRARRRGADRRLRARSGCPAAARAGGC